MFKNIESHHLDGITKSIREDPEVVLNAEDDLVDIFGMRVAANWAKFDFRISDKMLIMEMVEYVKKTISTKGLQYFQWMPTQEYEEKEKKEEKEERDKSKSETKAQFF